MRFTIRPSLAPDREFDVTDALIGAVAYKLSTVQGGNDTLNWLEAERFVLSLLTPAAAARRYERVQRDTTPLRPAPVRAAGEEYRLRKAQLAEPQPARVW